MNSRLMAVACALSLLAGSGCLSSRTLAGMNAAGDKNVTLIQTNDTYSVAFFYPLYAIKQFWKCSEAPGEITCTKVCSANDTDLYCPFAGAQSMGSIK